MLNLLTIDFEEWSQPEYVGDERPEGKLDRAKENLSAALNLLEKRARLVAFAPIGAFILFTAITLYAMLRLTQKMAH